MISLFVRRWRLTKLTPIMNRAAAYSAECSVAAAISVTSPISEMPAQRKARLSHRWGLATDLASKVRHPGADSNLRKGSNVILARAGGICAPESDTPPSA
jgi:hypothetical protein